MANIGIISEFNPFHTGHKHLINSVKTPDDAVICVMSGNFVQRGDVAILQKEERVRAALKNGADLIIEIPLPFAMSFAQRFAKSGVYLLNSLGVTDKICFGSECGDINKLEKIADIISSKEFEIKLSGLIKNGETFAKLRTCILREYNPEYAEILENPNNILGVEYILAARKINSPIKFETVRRTGASHDSDLPLQTASASYIREKMLSGNESEIRQFLPCSYSTNYANIKNLETAILSNLRMNNTPERYIDLPDISEGLENRIAEAVKDSTTLDGLYENIKTKRYTMARIRRTVLSAFLNINEKTAAQNPPYIRVIGFTQKGETTLKEIAEKATLPIVCTAKDAKKLSGFAKEIFCLECRATDIWALSLNYPQKCGNEYYYKVVKE